MKQFSNEISTFCHFDLVSLTNGVEKSSVANIKKENPYLQNRVNILSLSYFHSANAVSRRRKVFIFSSEKIGEHNELRYSVPTFHQQLALKNKKLT